MNRNMCGFALALLTAATVIFSAFTASAETRVPYQIYINASSVCSISSTGCAVSFPEVPYPKRLEITNVSCYFKLSNSPTISRILFVQLLSRLSYNHGITSANTLVPQSVNSTAAHRILSSNDQILFQVNGAQYPQVLLQISQGYILAIACSISGEMITP